MFLKPRDCLAERISADRLAVHNGSGCGTISVDAIRPSRQNRHGIIIRAQQCGGIESKLLIASADADRSHSVASSPVKPRSPLPLKSCMREGD